MKPNVPLLARLCMLKLPTYYMWGHSQGGELHSEKPLVLSFSQSYDVFIRWNCRPVGCISLLFSMMAVMFYWKFYCLYGSRGSWVISYRFIPQMLHLGVKIIYYHRIHFLLAPTLLTLENIYSGGLAITEAICNEMCEAIFCRVYHGTIHPLCRENSFLPSCFLAISNCIHFSEMNISGSTVFNSLFLIYFPLQLISPFI